MLKEAQVTEKKSQPVGLSLQRYFTQPGISPYDAVAWEFRTASIVNDKGEIVFEQKNVEVPSSWSQLATNIAASKYFHGHIGTHSRESSLRQLVGRVVDTITDWGIKGNYFKTAADAAIFSDELAHLLLTQKAAFNSPVWFNVGIEPRPQASACFINSVDDTMPSILDLAKTEGMLFKYGSGTGTNFSTIRSSKERLSTGGIASGPVSFMRGFDAFAGVIKSGGRTRRAAKMVIMNIDHPDVEEFITCKAREEKKAWTLIDNGYDGSLTGDAYSSIFFQNANHSVRVSDAFMEAVEKDGEWWTRAVTTGQPMDRYKARDLLRMIADSAHLCGDPGMQYDDTINRWHTSKNSGRINSSNPCFTGDSLVFTNKGLIPFRELIDRANNGEEFRIATDNRTGTGDHNGVGFTIPERYMITGYHDVYRLTFSNGMEVRCTKNHRFFTADRGMVSAEELTDKDTVVLPNTAMEFHGASIKLPVSTNFDDYRKLGDRHESLPLPTAWTKEFAELLGHLVGDGCISGAAVSWIYGSPQDKEEIQPRHVKVLEPILEQEPYTTVMGNGTWQMRTSRAPLKRFFEALGVKEAPAAQKAVPWSIFQAPTPIIAGFLRGLFSADGCVVDSPNGTRYVGLGSKSKELLQGVQMLLTTFGIFGRIYVSERSERSTFEYTRKDGTKVTYTSSGPSYDLRITGRSLRLFHEHINFLTSSCKDKLARIVQSTGYYNTEETVRLVSMEHDGAELTYNLTEPTNHSYIVNGLVVANCSEYMFLDDTACNLSSLNLMKFVREEDGSFDVKAFRAASETMITAQEIIVNNASYPTPRIAQNSHDYRPLGLGYANLGALLMFNGIPYDSDKGRDFSAAITAVMTGQAYLRSSEIARELGPFPGFEKNREPMLDVIAMHRNAVKPINPDHVPADLYQAAWEVWDQALELGKKYGYKNAQAVVLAPTGTIGLLMDCDTTGVEPDLALIKYKKLVGGGLMRIVNNTVPVALKRLGYSEQQTAEIVDYIDKNGTIEGAPHIREKDLPVFDCAFKAPNGMRSIQHMGHVKMMAAVQPFISGAISKTVNVPAESTVEDIMQTYVEGWKLGLKAIAIYRDGSKRTQPLNSAGTAKKTETQTAAPKTEVAPATETVVYKPVRRKLPNERRAITHKFSVGGHEGYITVGMFDDGSPGEIFLVMAKEGSTISGLMDAFATAISLALQYGVPLKALIDKFSHVRFEPSGFTGNPEIPMAKSVMDYIFRWLALKFLPPHERARVGIITPDGLSAEPPVVEGAAGPAAVEDPALYQTDAPSCSDCGAIMVRNGTCYKCINCGETSGCS